MVVKSQPLWPLASVARAGVGFAVLVWGFVKLYASGEDGAGGMDLRSLLSETSLVSQVPLRLFQQ